MTISRFLMMGGFPLDGQIAFYGTGSSVTGTWIVPTNVRKISVVCVGGGASGTGSWFIPARTGGGGGALSYSNDITVYPGETLNYQAGAGPTRKGTDGGDTFLARGSEILVKAVGGIAEGYGGDKSVCIGDVCNSGGSAKKGWLWDYGGGGGGAAGYSGDGGDAMSPGQGGGGGGGGNGGIFDLFFHAGGGGGVGLLGEGESGRAGGKHDYFIRFFHLTSGTGTFIPGEMVYQTLSDYNNKFADGKVVWYDSIHKILAVRHYDDPEDPYDSLTAFVNTSNIIGLNSSSSYSYDTSRRLYYFHPHGWFWNLFPYAHCGNGGEGGSGGEDGESNKLFNPEDGGGGKYGGGGAGGLDFFGIFRNGGDGGIGALRIMWGYNRNYPSTNTEDK